MWLECKDCIVEFLCNMPKDGYCGVNDEEMDKIFDELTSIRENGEKPFRGVTLGILKAIAQIKNLGYLTKDSLEFIKGGGGRPSYEDEFERALIAIEWEWGDFEDE